MQKGTPSWFSTVKGPGTPQGQMCARQSHLTLSLPWSSESKESSRERPAKPVPSCQDSSHEGEQNHLSTFIEPGKVAAGGTGSYICCLEFIELVYTHTEPGS